MITARLSLLWLDGRQIRMNALFLEGLRLLRTKLRHGLVFSKEQMIEQKPHPIKIGINQTAYSLAVFTETKKKACNPYALWIGSELQLN